MTSSLRKQAPVAPSDDGDARLLRYLQDIEERPFAAAAARDARLELSAYHGVQVRRALLELQCIEVHRISTGRRSGQIVLLELTPAGVQRLCDAGVSVRADATNVPFLRRFYVAALAAHAVRMWPDASVSSPGSPAVPGRTHDVVAIIPPRREGEQARSIALAFTPDGAEARLVAHATTGFDEAHIYTETARAAAILGRAMRVPGMPSPRITVTAISTVISPSARMDDAPTAMGAPTPLRVVKPGASGKRSPSRVWRPRTARVRQFVHAYQHLHDLDWLQESPLADLPAVRDRMNPLAAMPAGQALRALLVDSARQAARQASELPTHGRLRTFLERYLEARRVAEIARELGASREWCSRGYRRQALELAALQCEWLAERG